MNRKTILGGVVIFLGVLVLTLGFLSLVSGGGGSEISVGPDQPTNTPTDGDTPENDSDQIGAESEYVQNGTIVGPSDDNGNNYETDYRYERVTDDTPVPSVVADGLQTDQMLRNSLELANERGARITFVADGTHIDDDDVYSLQSGFTDDRLVEEVVYGDGDTVARFTEDGTGMQANVPEGGELTVSSSQPQSFEEVFNSDIYRPIIDAGWWEPTYTSVADGNRYTILEEDIVGNPEQLVDAIDEAEEIISYGGEIQVEEDGAMVKWAITVTFHTATGEEGVYVQRGGVTYGINSISKPDWVDETPTSSQKDQVELVNEKHLRVQADTDIPQGSKFYLTTATDQFNGPVPNIEQGDIVYIWLNEDGGVSITQTEPDTTTPIGAEYELLIESEDGVVLSDSNTSGG